MKVIMRRLRKIAPILSLVVVILMGCGNSEGEGWISTDITQEHKEMLQSQVDEGHKPGLLDWSQVAREYVSQEKKFAIDESVDRELVINEESKKIVQYTLTDGRLIQLELIQPVTKGHTGIYIVNKYRIMDDNSN